MAAERGRTANWFSLSIAVLAILLVWTIVLPRLEKRSGLQSRIEHLDRQGIDPGALYYTDLEGMPGWEAQVQAAQARDPDAFWTWGTSRED